MIKTLTMLLGEFEFFSLLENPDNNGNSQRAPGERLSRGEYFGGLTLKNMENHVLGFFMKNIVFHIYLGIAEYAYTV